MESGAISVNGESSKYEAMFAVDDGSKISN
jgi:hypothetical protein